MLNPRSPCTGIGLRSDPSLCEHCAITTSTALRLSRLRDSPTWRGSPSCHRMFGPASVGFNAIFPLWECDMIVDIGHTRICDATGSQQVCAPADDPTRVPPTTASLSYTRTAIPPFRRQPTILTVYASAFSTNRRRAPFGRLHQDIILCTGMSCYRGQPFAASHRRNVAINGSLSVRHMHHTSDRQSRQNSDTTIFFLFLPLNDEWPLMSAIHFCPASLHRDGVLCLSLSYVHDIPLKTVPLLPTSGYHKVVGV